MEDDEKLPIQYLEIITDESVMLTTIDNPFNPFNRYEDWTAFDEAKGYNTCAYLARVFKVPDDVSDLEFLEALNNILNEILFLNIIGVYCVITKKGSRFNPFGDPISDL